MEARPARGPLALAQNTLKPVNTKAGAAFGLHPRLTNLQALYNAKKAAMIFNMGTLVKPTTKQQYQNSSVPLPRNLYSHSDQQSQWQTSNPTVTGGTGWGGRVNDVVAPAQALHVAPGRGIFAAMLPMMRWAVPLLLFLSACASTGPAVARTMAILAQILRLIIWISFRSSMAVI